MAIILGVFLGLVVVLGGLYAWDYANTKGNVPRGTTIGGVSVGGMKPAAAHDKLVRELGGVENEAVTVTAGEKTAQLVPAESGLSIDLEETVRRAGTEPANPLAKLRGLVSTTEIPVVSYVDEAALQPQLERVRGELSTDPINGGVVLEGGKVKTNKPVDGQTVDMQQLHSAVSDRWLDPQGVKVKPSPVAPAIGQEAVDAIAKGPAAKAVESPITVRGHQNVTGTIAPDRMGEVVSFPEHEGKLTPVVNTEAAQAILAEQLAASEVEGTNARVKSDGSITPHVDGEVVDWEATMAGFDKRALGEDAREFDATYKPQPAEYTTEEAQNATFNEVVGEFTTGEFSQSSGKNISVIAAQVNGAIVNPGETFSVNQFTGPRGTAQGYVEGGIIENGRAGKAVGGGISQFATTLYNAAYFAGMKDVAHTPHSYYISRYPAGREATIFDGAIDLVFKNTTQHPVKIVTEMGSDTITVKLMGVKTLDVQSINGGRWAQTSPQRQQISGSGCIPSSGIPGFTTSDTRIIRDLSGNELDRQTQTTVYDPQPIVTCTG
ncbi:hypothetical protein FHE74_09895 [Corynebacterium tapiri]|uniref:YoaR-like putative peptidoglycan binding domain-containing protein n=1 Tax=Corynebacterium tapiri TaxID=1448266 RepID=A0A5C4U3G9_9CORY|nr:hypothetical protein FHE74_09895 [Corynebacterium tapiri]